MTVAAEINRLESDLAKTLESIPQHAAALATQKADAEKLLAEYVACPVADTLAKLQNAHGTISAAAAVLASIGNPAAWPDKVKSAWVTTHYAELVGLLERVIHERSARRQAFRDVAGIELGRLTTEIVKADGNDAPDSELVRLNGQLAATEDDMADREYRLNAANEQLKAFRLANGVDGGRDSYHGPLFNRWTYAKDAALGVDFEPHLSEIEKHVAAHPIQKAVTTRTRRTPATDNPRSTLTVFNAGERADNRTD
jgi:hypothetical protein